VTSLWKPAFGATCLMIQPLLLNLVSLPVTAYIIAVLGPEAYGQWAVALTLVTTVTILTNVGLRSFFIRAVAQHPEQAPEALAEQLGARAVMAIGAGAVAVGLVYALGYPAIVKGCTVILACGLIFTTVAAASADLLQAKERAPALATINLVSGLLLTATSFAAMWFRTGPMGLAVCYLVGPISAAVFSLAFIQSRLFPIRVSWSPRTHWRLLRQSKMLGLQQVVITVGTQCENLIVPKLVGVTSYGYFAAGTLLPRRLEVVPDALSTTFYPLMAKAYRENAEANRLVVRRFTILLVGLCLPAAGLLFLLADPIARLLFPSDPEICRLVLRITVWSVPLIGLANGMGYALNAAGQEAAEVRLSIVGGVASLACSAALIMGFGLVGASIALLARGVIGIVVRLPYFLRSSAWRRNEVVPTHALGRMHG
jgi:O-antigen/teichoic acid export membrane protein